MEALKKIGGWLVPPPNKSEDGRDQWPNRAAFLLAAMGGCAGMGNLLRYPSQVFNNHGLQWFIPYLICIFLIAIPALVLEIATGQAYRGGCVVAFNRMHYRLRGMGLTLVYMSFVVGPYFVVNLAWIMHYFRASFTSPLPWTGDAESFYMAAVVANPDPVPGRLTADGSAVASYTQYPGVALVGETVGWTAFTWFLMWACIFRGVGLTGRVVWFTMALPVLMTLVLIGRSVSLPNAADGIRLYFATWNGEQLARGQIWQTACGQVFFSTGVGFGYFTSYASYNRKHSNAVMDAVVIVTSNAVFETVAAFAAFGVIGFIGLHPEEGTRLGSFTLGFLTLPLAISEMPGANFWAALLFFTLMVLGYSSAFAMLDAVATLVMDTGAARSRPLVVTCLALLSFLLSLPYCTELGYYLLDGVDRWVNDVALVFVVWAECVTSTTVYRWRDVVGQVGPGAFAAYNAGYLGGQVVGVTVAHSVGPAIGAVVGFAVYIFASAVSVLLAKTPDQDAPKLCGKNAFASRFWYLAFYSGNQLRRDLNLIVGTGDNWTIPAVWAPLIRYVSAPILAIVYGFAYPAFYETRYDPLHIFGFAVAHLALVIVALGFVLPRWFIVLIPPCRRGDGKLPYAPNVVLGSEHGQGSGAETGDSETVVVKDEGGDGQAAA